MFEQVLEKLDNYFGRSFLVARYFPWLLFAAINLAIASVEFSSVRTFISAEYQALSASKALDLALAMLGVWVIAYATAPLADAVTRFLEGAWIPDRWAKYLIASHAWRREKLDWNYRSASKHRDEVPELTAVIGQWRRDRSTGTELGAIQSKPAIERVRNLIDGLRVQRWLNEPVSIKDFNHLNDALASALRNNCADEKKLRDPDDEPWAKTLRELHDDALILAHYVLDISEQIESRAQLERDREFAKTELAPTRLGNDAAALRSYCETRYGISFDLFWPRYLLLIEKDSKVGDALSTSKMQLDFSILALTLTVLTTLVWGFAIFFIGHSLWTFAIVYLFGPATISLWLGVVHNSYAAFADLVRSSIDMKRFDVLDQLRRPLPVSTDAEKRIWEDYTRLAALDEHKPNTTFRHPAKS